MTAIFADYDHPMGNETTVGAKKFKFPAQRSSKDESSTRDHLSPKDHPSSKDQSSIREASFDERSGFAKPAKCNKGSKSAKPTSFDERSRFAKPTKLDEISSFDEPAKLDERTCLGPHGRGCSKPNPHTRSWRSSHKTNQTHSADPSNLTRYHGGWITPRTLPNINLPLSLAIKAPLNTPTLQESAMTDPLSVERHIHDVV